MGTLLLAYIPTLAFQLPVLIVFLVGIVLAIVRWKKHPKVSLLVVVALVLFGFTTLANWASSPMIYVLSDQFGYDTETIGIVLTATSVLSTLINLLCWIFIVLAVYGWRKKLNPSPEPGFNGGQHV